MFSNLKKSIVNDNELESDTLRILSLIFLLISGVMSFFKYTQNIEWWPDAERTFEPRLISTIIAIF